MIVNLKICIIFDHRITQKKVYGTWSIFRVFSFFNHFYYGILDADFPINYSCALLVVWKFDGELEIKKGGEKGQIKIKKKF